MRARQLVDQARLPDPGLADQGHELPLPLAGLPERPAQLLDLRLAPHEAGQAPGGRHLEARPLGGRAGQLLALG